MKGKAVGELSREDCDEIKRRTWIGYQVVIGMAIGFAWAYVLSHVSIQWIP